VKLRYLILLSVLILSGCASRQPALLSGQSLEGSPIYLNSRDNIPAAVKKFSNERDLTTEEGKIDYLFDRIKNSKLTFIRNKVEYDSDSAAKFIRWKLNRWRGKGSKITTAQQFVSEVTSGSKMSGEPYTVILHDGTRHNLQPVLQNELNALEQCLQQYPSDAATKPNLSSEPAPVV